jgi:hypothetical protein
MSTLEKAPGRRFPTQGPFVVESFKAAGLRALTAEEEKRLSQGAVSMEGREAFESVRERERESLKAFFGEDVDVPDVPSEVTPEQYEQWKQMGMEMHYVPLKDMTEDKNYPGWKKKPTSNINLFNAIKDTKNKLVADTLKLPGAWVVVDTREKPQYQSGNQMYANDPFKDVIEELRKQKVISGGKAGSRFEISWDELHKPEVKAKLAEILGIAPDNLRLPRAIEMNFLGNAHYQKWGDTNTWEWFEDSYQGSRRLLGGDSDYGGLSYVDWGVSGHRLVSSGFRPLIVFPA